MHNIFFGYPMRTGSNRIDFPGGILYNLYRTA